MNEARNGPMLGPRLVDDLQVAGDAVRPVEQEGRERVRQAGQGRGLGRRARSRGVEDEAAARPAGVLRL